MLSERREELRVPSVDLPGGNWELIQIRRPKPMCMTAMLVNKNTGQRYVVSYNDGRLSYMREWREPKNIPKFVDEFIRSKARQI